jgi:hypothetical protein
MRGEPLGVRSCLSFDRLWSTRRTVKKNHVQGWRCLGARLTRREKQESCITPRLYLFPTLKDVLRVPHTLLQRIWMKPLLPRITLQVLLKHVKVTWTPPRQNVLTRGRRSGPHQQPLSINRRRRHSIAGRLHANAVVFERSNAMAIDQHAASAEQQRLNANILTLYQRS